MSSVPHQSDESLRKSLHILFGLFAFTLKWMPWWMAAVVALCAIIGNWLLLHRIFGKRVARHERGWDAGIVLYPAAVLLLILFFRDRLEIAAVAWTTLAFGDGLATVVGKRFPLVPLSWNRDKSAGGLVAFLAGGIASGLAMTWWLGRGEPADVIAAVIVAALVETLPLGVNDNITVPFAAAVTLTVLAIEPALPYVPWPRTQVWLVINTILAIAGWALRTVDFSGFIGGWFLGTVIILGGGWPLYVALLAFFIIGTFCTKIGYARKARRGLAQEKEGRRGFSHAFSNTGVAAICAIAVTRLARTSVSTAVAITPLFMAMASLATAAADTTASEIGQLIGRRAFLPLSLRRVAVGTEGAISLEGTVAGILGGAVVAMAGTTAASIIWPLPYRTHLIVLITICAFAGSYLESLAGNWNRRAGSPVPNGVLNFFNTAAGALLFYIAWQIEI